MQWRSTPEAKIWQEKSGSVVRIHGLVGCASEPFPFEHKGKVLTHSPPNALCLVH